jgi:type IV secretory pathway TraG/TraD family ATPase VirD4
LCTVQEDSASSWLFISSLGDKHESLKPLITAWLDIAANALLSLTPKPSRRVWVILDELTSLQRLPYLTTALSKARKFGGCFVVWIQSYAQLAKVYGHEGAREISSPLNTRFMFRVPDPEIAQWSAKNLGERTLEDVQESIRRLSSLAVSLLVRLFRKVFLQLFSWLHNFAVDLT